jgi:SARP family transcriptional regulator, regulator of embCAB operon
MCSPTSKFDRYTCKVAGTDFPEDSMLRMQTIGDRTHAVVESASARHVSNARVRIEVLGSFRCLVDRRVVELAPESQNLIRVLASSRGAWIPSVVLEDVATSIDGHPGFSSKSVEEHILQLQLAIGVASINSRGFAHQLNFERVCVDAIEFENLALELETLHHRRRLESVCAVSHQALALWRLPLCSAIHRSSRAVAARPPDRWHRVADLRALALLELGRFSEVVALTGKALRLNPQHEQSCANLMIAFYESGRIGDAMCAYDNFRSGLDAEALEPGPSLQMLAGQIGRGESLPGTASLLKSQLVRSVFCRRA